MAFYKLLLSGTDNHTITNTCAIRIVQYLTIICYVDWDKFISRRDDISITASAEADVKMFHWLKVKVIHNSNIHRDTCDSISECECFCDSDVVLWI